jgi:hypothetical protein
MDRSINECKDLLKLFKKIKIFEYDEYIYVVFHEYHYFTLLLVVDLTKNEIKYYDSWFKLSEKTCKKESLGHMLLTNVFFADLLTRS